MKTLQHWEQIAQRWSHLSSPLRPCPADVRNFSELLELAPSRPLRVLILGVTPELFQLQWPLGTSICSADRSPEMIQAVWPGPSETAFHADWLDLPFSAASFDRVLCDGGLHLLAYPDDHLKLSNSVARLLSPGGRFLIRLFARPPDCEAASVVTDDLFAGTIANFHAFKLRLAMALQSSPVTGIILDQVYRHVLDAVGSLERLSTLTGWPIEEVSTLQSYQDSRNVYHFLSELESVEALTAHGTLALERRLEGEYSLGERCPVLSFRKA